MIVFFAVMTVYVLKIEKKHINSEISKKKIINPNHKTKSHTDSFNIYFCTIQYLNWKWNFFVLFFFLLLNYKVFLLFNYFFTFSFFNETNLISFSRLHYNKRPITKIVQFVPTLLQHKYMYVTKTHTQRIRLVNLINNIMK